LDEKAAHEAGQGVAHFHCAGQQEGYEGLRCPRPEEALRYLALRLNCSRRGFLPLVHKMTHVAT